MIILLIIVFILLIAFNSDTLSELSSTYYIIECVLLVNYSYTYSRSKIDAYNQMDAYTEY